MYFLHIFMLFYTLFLMSVKMHLFHFAKNVQKCEKCPKYPHIWGVPPPPPNTPKKVYVRYPHTPSKRPFWGCFRGILKHTKSQFHYFFACFSSIFIFWCFFRCFCHYWQNMWNPCLRALRIAAKNGVLCTTQTMLFFIVLNKEPYKIW